MFKNIGTHKLDPRDKAVRIFSLVTSCIVFAMITYVVLLMANVIPTAESREYERRQRRGQEILEILDPEVVEAGFIRKATSADRDIYMPQLVLRLANSSNERFEQIVLECRFSKGEQSICGGRAYANDLKPGEVRRVTLKCVESMFTGAVIYGIGLEDARRGLEYEIILRAENIGVIALTDTLVFKVI
jgi:hypothetical protein